MSKLLALLAASMLALVLFLHVTLGKGIAEMALGYSAGLVVAGCALACHRYQKGELR